MKLSVGEPPKFGLSGTENYALWWSSNLYYDAASYLWTGVFWYAIVMIVLVGLIFLTKGK